MTRPPFLDAQENTSETKKPAEIPNSKKYQGRIPTRLPNLQKTSPNPKEKSLNNDDMDCRPIRRVRPQSNESGAKSIKRANNEVTTIMASRSTRTERERFSTTPRKISAIPKKVPMRLSYTNKNINSNKCLVTVPVCKKLIEEKSSNFLPQQETIEIYEAQIDKNNSDPYFDEGLLSSCSNDLLQIKLTWQRYLKQYDKMKQELADRQTELLDFLHMLRHFHEKVTSKRGEIDIDLPDTKDLSLINFGMSPELINTSPGSKSLTCAGFGREVQAIEDLEFDVHKLFKMPLKLVTICEKLLSKRKEVIDWFESLLNDTSKEKGFGKNMLRTKICHYNTENRVLYSDLEKNKTEFYSELNDFLNKGVRETLKMAVEENSRIKAELDDARAQNESLCKQLRDRSRNYSPNRQVKQRIEDLEKELKEEKSKAPLLKDRLQKAERKIKTTELLLIKSEHTVESMVAKNCTLERTIKHLKTQNQEIQEDFDQKITNLTNSIEKSTNFIEEIASAREKLQKEKEELEKKLSNITDSYNETLTQLKTDINDKVQKLSELQDKYNKEVDEKENMKTEIDSLNIKLNEFETSNQNLNVQIKEKENNEANCEKNTEVLKKDLNAAKEEILSLKEVIHELEEKQSNFLSLEQMLRTEIQSKTEINNDLKNKIIGLEEEYQQSKITIKSYEERITESRNKISQLQHNIETSENIQDLKKMLNEQQLKVSQVKSQNDEMISCIKSKEMELKQKMKQLTELENVIEEKESLIKMLLNKDEEQTNIIKLLRNNLQMKNQTESEFQPIENKSKIENLIKNLDLRKKQISELEKNIITLEDQARKANAQKKKDHDQIRILLKKIANYESYHTEINRTIDAPSEHLDSILQILEKEICNSVDQNEESSRIRRNCNDGDSIMSEKVHFSVSDKCIDSLALLASDPETKLTKILVENCTQKNTANNKEKMSSNNDNSNNKAIKRITINFPQDDDKSLSPVIKKNASLKNDNLFSSKDDYILRNFQLIMPCQIRDEKKNKMFKIAGHKL